ncbi:uncharacterized protein LOC126094976 [Schistocerca cancellata]|uniref:uncharacterized protein LOC126094976 n=1 Tax=Schistocerca cancellata TaxID=274614 RepID=UPI0021188007|nr:uncharacterized protein LOC126094976 [Schistocerca cancellata]
MNERALEATEWAPQPGLWGCIDHCGGAPAASVVLLVLLVVAAGVAAGAEPRAARVKRKLVFLEGTTFWVRLNIKKDILPYTNLFAFAYGFRVNYPLPTGAKDFPFKRIFRRDVYGDLEHLISQHGLDGRACVLRAICEAASLEKPRGLVQKLLHRIFSVPADEAGHLQPYHVLEGGCERLHESCPLSLLHMTVMVEPDDDI